MEGAVKKKDTNWFRHRLKCRNPVLTGIDTILGTRSKTWEADNLEAMAKTAKGLVGKRLGLITNPTGVTKTLKAALDGLHEHEGFHLAAGFSPEHGLRGEVQDALHIGDFRDADTGVPIYSLYGENRRPTSRQLADLDALVFDIQDVGVRFYTYISTMLLAMEACAEADVEFTVLDRPNPISGTKVEGGILKQDFTSFVGSCAIPIRHGLTVGELALWANEMLGINARLTVCQVQGWQRPMWADDTDLPWVMPSPNIPTLETAVVYPGTCFIEGTNLSEGRGTTKPFELFGAPWISGRKLAAHLNALELPGCRFRPVFFEPTFSKHAGKVCQGVQIHVIDREMFQSVASGVHILKIIHKLYPHDFKWIATLEQEAAGRLHIDLLAGTDELRKTLDGRDYEQGVDDLLNKWQTEAASFQAESKAFLLYRK